MTAPAQPRESVRPLVIACALALAETYFPKHAGDISGTHAQFLVTGRIDAWPGYWLLAEEDRQRVASLLGHRPDELASEELFARALSKLLAEGALDGYRASRTGEIEPIHGLPAREHADRLLSRLTTLKSRRSRILTFAHGARYSHILRTRRQGDMPISTRAVYNLSDIAEQSPSPIHLPDAPRMDMVELDTDELITMAERIDKAHGESHRRDRLDEMLKALIGADGRPVPGGIRIPAGGPTSVLQAPTGRGKTVLLEVKGTLAAEKGIPIALVVPTRSAALRLAYRIEHNLTLLGIRARCTPLLSPQRLMEDAENAATADPGGFGLWAYDRLSYGCALAASAETEDAVDTWSPGHEPCGDLRRIRGDGRQDSRQVCPWRESCGKFRTHRDAADATVIVTAHQTFFSGRVHLSLATTAATSDRITVEEFLLRRCQLIVIDEFDEFQDNAIGHSANHLVLADGRRRTTLFELDGEFRAAFGNMPPEIGGEIRATLSDLRLLAEGYTENLAGGYLSPVRPGKRRMRADHWLVPRGHDAWITARLLGLPFGGRGVTLDEVEALQQLYPGVAARAVDPLRIHVEQEQTGPADLASAQAEKRSQISEVLASVANGCRDRVLSENSQRLSTILETVVPDDHARGMVVDRMLRRAYLEPMRARLSELHFHTSHLRAVGVDSADDIADALGGFAQWSAMPASPLGRLFFAFQERLDPEEPETSRLAVAAFGGDPHGYAVYLGELTARGQAGVPRAVMGLSATSYMPGAPHHHIHSKPTWIMPDTDPTGVTIHADMVYDAAGNPLRVSGISGRSREDETRKVGHALFRKLERHLSNLHDQRRRDGQPGRDRILVATTSYASVFELAEGLMQAGAAPDTLCLVTRKGEQAAVKDARWSTVTSDRIETFPDTGAKILIAPLGVVERGVNLLVGDTSALGAIYLVIRPVPVLDQPDELLAHINHRLWAKFTAPAPGSDPVQASALRMKNAGRLFEEIVTSAQYFRSLPDWVQRGIVAEIIIGLIQLVGRARRGGTPGEVHLVDAAFFDDRGKSSLPRLIHELQQEWHAIGELDFLRTLYGPTLQAFMDFAVRNRPDDAGDQA